MKRVLCAVFALGVLAGSAGPTFQTALPVWPEGRATRMNDFVEFRTSFDAKSGEKPILRVTGSSVYRIRLNGEFAGYGPARAAKGFFRVDEWPLAAREGRNDLCIEVSAYNCNNYYIAEWPGFLQAEVVCGGRVLAATCGTENYAQCASLAAPFTACETPRVTKCSRYSFQRAFGEAYKLALGWKGDPLTLGVQPAVPLVERIAPLPDFPVTKIGAPISATKVRRKDQIKYRPIRSVDNPEPTFKLYEAKTLDVNIWRELQHVEVVETAAARSASAPYQMADGNGLVFDVGFNESGFPGLTVSCTKPGRLWMAFDEILQDGKVNPLRYGVANGVVWDLQPGRYRVEAFEPYTFRYLHVFALGGDFQIEAPYMRGYKNPDAKKAKFRASDPDLEEIFNAARETFAQNAVDVFTDCPSRERAGWLCDSFFTGRCNLLFTGNTDLERLFIQNYLLPNSFPELPDGALPMCYPSDHPNHNFIPNWAMWFVIELDEYLVRSGDRATVDALKPRLVKLIDYLKTFRNSDGLLEKLPAWVFVEWSMANKLVQDVNYPSNMTWAEVLDCMDRLYGMPELAAEAKKVRETVRKQSWNGTWFCDNAVRQADGTLKLSGKCTETCQYYAFFMHTATPETHPVLWKTLVEDFGPQRRETKKHPEIYPANAFIGNYLRLDLLGRAGLGKQILRETKGYFKYMADRTGTLWENDTPHASCNHGFASHAAVFYVRDVLGVKSVDIRAKTVTLADTDADVTFCEATLPVPCGELMVARRLVKGRPVHSYRLPKGWRAVKSAALAPEWKELLVQVKSSLDGTLQPCYFWAPEAAKEKSVPLIVGLHTWSADYRQTSHYATVLKYAREKGWAMVGPNFRGPNKTPPACGGDPAVQDIVDAVDYAKAHAKIDAARVYIVGGSGGGHMTLLMLGRHPEVFAAGAAFCPITDLARWHADSLLKHPGRGKHYAAMLEQACGGTPAEKPEEYARRSPLSWLANARAAGVPAYIVTGIHDGWKGSVPVGHSFRAFNALANPRDRVDEAAIASIEETQAVPEALAYMGPKDPFYSDRMRIHFRRTSANVRFTLMEGGHGGNFAAGLDFLSRQAKGRPADFSLPAKGRGGEEKLGK